MKARTRKWLPQVAVENIEAVDVNTLKEFNGEIVDTGISEILSDGDILAEDIESIDKLRTTVETMPAEAAVTSIPVINAAIESYCKRWEVSPSSVAIESNSGVEGVLASIAVAKEGLADTAMKWLKELYERFKKLIGSLKDFVNNLTNRNKKTSGAIAAIKKSPDAKNFKVKGLEVKTSVTEDLSKLAIGQDKFAGFDKVLNGLRQVLLPYDVLNKRVGLFGTDLATEPTTVLVPGGTLVVDGGHCTFDANTNSTSIDEVVLDVHSLDMLENILATITDKCNRIAAGSKTIEKQLDDYLKRPEEQQSEDNRDGLKATVDYCQKVTDSLKRAYAFVDALVVSILKNFEKSANSAEFGASFKSALESGDVKHAQVALGTELLNKRKKTSVFKSMSEAGVKTYSDFFEPFRVDGWSQEMDSNKDNWNKDYLFAQKLYLSANFSKERFNHVLRVREHVWPDTKG